MKNIFIVFLTIYFATINLNAQENRVVRDIDGNEYKTVVIGNQTWMAENLRVTHYNDGKPIPMVEDFSVWISLTAPAYCWYNNNKEQFKDSYGALYNWYTVDTGKLCPAGWRAPDAGDWDELVGYAGSNAGGKLKESGFSHWKDANNGAVDEYGFTALPGGLRNLNGDFDYLRYSGNWWSSSEHSTENSLLRTMYFANGNARQHSYSKNLGLSVRCIRN